MTFKTVSIIISLASYILLILSASYGFNQAKKVHKVSLKDVKNEVPGGFLLRTICSLVYYFSIVDWIGGFNLVPWSYFPFQSWVHYAGLFLLILTVIFFWWIHITLGSNYHGPMKLHENHRLVTAGPYQFVRHPMYIAFPMLHTSLFLITENYLLLLSGLVMSLYVNHKRIIVEEKLLTERFGNEYTEYKKRAGMYFPRFINKRLKK